MMLDNRELEFDGDIAIRMIREALRKAVASLKDGVKSEGADNMKKGCRAADRVDSSFKAAAELLLDTMERMILDLENRWGAGDNQLDELPLAMVFSEALDPRTVDFAYMEFNGTVDGKTIWDLIADAVFGTEHNLADATSLAKKRKRPNDEDEVASARRADNKARKAGAWGDLLSKAKAASSSLTNHNEGAKEGEAFASVSAKGRPHICRSPTDVLRSRI
ncbi:hypothetical protein PsorP6_008863 [Peronosclerospora sorghi]|uniref:Uncharacterized protein n=1 Tax=Peronosclerospora sorghi TaxID=230839 RepID=A0ACC0W0N0_9STRA|nr:hypothetical protein PsorP6_008863 [Peronosclerospora sorghi]